jgi:hypothetical protein
MTGREKIDSLTMTCDSFFEIRRLSPLLKAIQHR